MPTGRHSKRLAGNKPSAEKPTKRARKPNSHTLDAFSTKQAPLQAPVQRQGTGQRKIIKAPDLPKP